MTIREAIVEVLKSENRPLSMIEIHDRIVKQGLFQFSAKKPLEIVAKVVRKHRATLGKEDKQVRCFSVDPVTGWVSLIS